MFARALVAFDGSPGSRRALELGVRLAAEHGSALTVLTVEAHLPHYARPWARWTRSGATSR